MKFSIVTPTVLFCLLSAPLAAEDELNFEDKTVRINYSLGYQIGGDFKRQGVDMNADAVVQGIRDALSDSNPQMSQPEMTATLMELKRKVVAEQHERKAQTEIERVNEGAKFMEENAKKEGVVTTASGMQYKVIEAGSGSSPGPEDKVTVHYAGKLIDGMVFDSSHKKGKPVTFGLNRVIKGWSEGLQMMKEGGKSQLVIPPKLAYGDRGPLANRTLIFDVELLSIEKPEPEKAEDKSKASK